MVAEPILKWNHLYCAVPVCGYPITPFPAEGDSATCMACGEMYTLANVREPAPPVLKAAFTSDDFAFGSADPSVKIGVDWLTKVAGGGDAEKAKTIMDTIMEFCPTCKERTKCTYYSKQTRGADEGQTQFYTCTKCENEWKTDS
eukprot:TRINITY_DN29821_c0_g1_i1.p1 TRINITY_DN29821_c0_g1~~TRINITY_DN29821_c0_g1_i1.p1  ORF type:complete len:144 (+),score=53.54 TRINITY_DN29821_c0_g1_i1:56-487(+)